MQSLNMCGIDCGEAHPGLAAAVVHLVGMEVFCDIPMQGLRDDTISELQLSRKRIGMHGALVLAYLLQKTRYMHMHLSID